MMQAQFDIQLSDLPLSAEQCTAWVSDAGAGGVVVFVGTVRNHTQGRTVERLEFEAYAPMALSELRKIAARQQRNGRCNAWSSITGWVRCALAMLRW